MLPRSGQFERVLVAGAYLPDRSFLDTIGVAPEDRPFTDQIAFSRRLESIDPRRDQKLAAPADTNCQIEGVTTHSVRWRVEALHL